jgi:metallo-beta-lactamase family protein
MKICFHGAAKEVTGTKHLVEINDKKILLDCGMFQGHREEADEKNKEFGFDPKEIDIVVLSHAHIDHSGLLPYLVKRGFKGSIISTYATRDLCTYMLQDSAYIQEREVEYMRKKRTPGIVEPLYTTEDVLETLKRFMTIAYDCKTEILPGVFLTFLEAGHVLGSAMIYLEMEDKKDGKKKTLTFTGDRGRKGLPILRDPAYVSNSDFLITETTYGNRFHEFVQEIDDKFEKLINETVAKGGKIIIPAFALERTQEVVYHLNVLMQAKRIPDIPVFVDSPLAINLTTVFRSHPECFDKHVYTEFLQNDKNPFGYGRLTYITQVEDSKALNNKNGPMIIISASGMAEHGRILHHIKNNIEDPRTLILIVGYQAENTLGRKLVNGEKQVKIFGKTYRNKASVEVLDAFSGHADRSDLIDFISHFETLGTVFLVHGEETQLATFETIMGEIKPETKVEIPERGQCFEV